MFLYTYVLNLSTIQRYGLQFIDTRFNYPVVWITSFSMDTYLTACKLWEVRTDSDLLKVQKAEVEANKQLPSTVKKSRKT